MAKVALLRTAEEVFAQHGLSDARVEDISRRAGLSKGSFYLHFESKEEAFKEVVEGFLARFTSLILPAEGSSPVPTEPARVLDFVVEHDAALFEFLWQNRDFVKIVDGCHGPYAYLLDGFNRTMIDASRAWIQHWQQAGLMRPEADPNLAAILINGAYQALARAMIAAKSRPPVEAWLEETVALFFTGLGTPSLVEAIVARRRKRNQSSGIQRLARLKAPRPHRVRGLP